MALVLFLLPFREILKRAEITDQRAASGSQRVYVISHRGQYNSAAADFRHALGKLPVYMLHERVAVGLSAKDGAE